MKRQICSWDKISKLMVLVLFLFCWERFFHQLPMFLEIAIETDCML